MMSGKNNAFEDHVDTLLNDINFFPLTCVKLKLVIQTDDMINEKNFNDVYWK